MARLDRYLLSQLMVLFGFFSLVLVGVYWVNRAVTLFDQLIGDGQTAMVFLEFTALSLPSVIRLVLPVSAFVAAVYATNRLMGESELVVMQATGFSPFRLARPVLVFGLIVALMLAVLMNLLVPASRTQLSLRSVEITRNITARFLTEGAFLHPSDGITLYVREITPLGELRDIFLSDARAPSQNTTYTAKRALLVRGDTSPKLIMFDGLAETLRPGTGRLFTTSFANFAYDIGGLIAVQAPGARRAAEFPTWGLLVARPEDLAAANQSRAVFLAEAHNRLAQPLLATVSALIGFAALMLGGFSRFGVWRQIILAVVTLILVQLVNNYATDLAQGDDRLWPLCYLPMVLGGAVATGMLWLGGRNRRVARSSARPVAA